MTDIDTRKAELENMLRTANLLDDQGKHDMADEITRIAQAGVAALEDDIDADNAAAPVDDTDPFAKGFGKSLVTLSKKLGAVCSASNCHRKLEALCEAKDCDADELFIALRKAYKLLNQVVG